MLEASVVVSTKAGYVFSAGLEWLRHNPRRMRCRRSAECGSAFQGFNKKYEADRKAKREAAKEEKGQEQPRKKS
jgi:hypothetical protein